MSEKKLLPCPFCGGEAELYRTRHIPNGFDYTPRCKKSGCCGRLTKKYGLKDTAVDFWNTRVPMQKIVGRLEDVRLLTVQNACLNEAGPECYDISCETCYMDRAIDIVKEEGGLNDCF